MATKLEHSTGETDFLRLLDKLPAAAYTCDVEGLITYYNKQALDLWGRAPKLRDPLDRFCGSFRLHSVDGELIAHDKCWMALALDTDRDYIGCEIVVERPDGEHRNVLAYASPIHDTSGAPVGAVNVLVDISERRRAEEALKETVRARNEFLAVLSHELRNPLAAIPFAIEMLRPAVATSPESQSALDVIERQTQQISKLVDDLVDLARLSVNKLKLSPERVDLTDIVHSVEKATRPIVDAAGQTLTVGLPSEPVFVFGDVTRLKQVVTNILQNAINYNTQHGQIWLTLAREGLDAVIKIRDTGVGISDTMLERIFEIFEQAKPRLNQSQNGLGIGLSVVKRLVDLHQGTIIARSDGPGNGSEFEVRLPILVDDLQGAKSDLRDGRY